MPITPQSHVRIRLAAYLGKPKPGRRQRLECENVCPGYLPSPNQRGLKYVIVWDLHANRSSSPAKSPPPAGLDSTARRFSVCRGSTQCDYVD